MSTLTLLPYSWSSPEFFFSFYEINILFFSAGFLIVMKLSFSGPGEGLMVRLEDRRVFLGEEFMFIMETDFLGEEDMLEMIVTGVRMFATGELIRLRGVSEVREVRLLI